MFVDASAIVAIVTDEPDAEVLLGELDRAARPITSPIAIYEAALGVRRKRESTVAEGLQDVVDLLMQARVATVPITEATATAALDAFARYGKGSGHPARLNMGDCFAYAVATTHGASLLFKCGDFAATDVGAAIGPA